MAVNIPIKTDRDFEISFNAMKNKYGEDFEYLNGFHETQLNFSDFIDGFIDKNVADVTIDVNANAHHKDICSLSGEKGKSEDKLFAFNKIFYELKKKYGLKTARKWLKTEWNGGFYLHDASSASFKPYCYAYDLTRLSTEGLFFLDDYNNEPPKHLTTFFDDVIEFISFFSNRSSGACGLPNLLVWGYYFWKHDIEEDYYIKNPDYYMRQCFQKFVYRINQPFLRVDQSAFLNISIFDRNYYEALFGGVVFPDGTFAIDYIDDFIDYQKAFMEVVSDIRSHNMFTFPVLTMSLLRQNGKFVDEDFARWCSEHNRKWTDSNFFVDDSVTSLSNCCRLKSDVSDMIDDELGYFNSIGGTALSVGSVKVSSINLARLALENKTEEDYLNNLKEVVEIDCIALDIVRSIIKRNVDKGLLPNFSKGLVDFKHLYNTVGFTGIYETMKRFGYTTTDELGNTYYTKEAEDFGRKIFEVIHSVKDEFAKDKDYKINLEQIPGESACAKMFLADKMLYPRKTVKDLPLYGNQFLPLGIQATLQERTRVASLFDSFCNGGSIQHINIEAPFDSEKKAWDMLNWVADMGVTYFAFTTKINACEDNHAFFGSVCPVCGKPVHTQYERIVGFYTPVKTWSKERKAENNLRLWHDLNNEGV